MWIKNFTIGKNGIFKIRKMWAPNVGLESTALRLRVSCSTDWASGDAVGTSTTAIHFAFVYISVAYKIRFCKLQCYKVINLIVNKPNRPLITAPLSLYTRLKPTCNNKIEIMGLDYIFNEWALQLQSERSPVQILVGLDF